MRQATFEYKCRRCGAIDSNPHGGEQVASEQLTYAVVGLPTHPQLGLLHIHDCADDGRGVADLVGYRVEERTG